MPTFLSTPQRGFSLILFLFFFFFRPNYISAFKTDPFSPYRHEHSARGGCGSPLRSACLRSVPHHQQSCDGLWQPQQGKPRGGAEDHKAPHPGSPESHQPPDDQDLAPSLKMFWLRSKVLENLLVLLKWCSRWWCWRWLWGVFELGFWDSKQLQCHDAYKSKC